MNEQNFTDKAATGVLNVPMAIVIAGGLVALAIYFGNAGIGKNTDVAAVPTTAAPAGQVAQPTPGVGDFRAVNAQSDHIRGAENAKVTILEYSDLECPFCKQFHQTLTQIMKDYPNDVRWVYRHAPLEQLHKKAMAEANAAECAAEQGKFWEFIDLVFEATKGNDSLVLEDMPKLAGQAGVANISQFESCVSSNKYAEKVANDLADAGKAGMRGTPYSVIIGPQGQTAPVNGAQPISSVKTTIDSLLK